jgi:3-phenylpropionate/cinnamic acid dioxygenase small subunit
MQTVIQRYDATFANQVRKGFNRAEQLIDKQTLADWLAQYMESQEYLSDEIEKLISTIEPIAEIPPVVKTPSQVIIQTPQVKIEKNYGQINSIENSYVTYNPQ